MLVPIVHLHVLFLLVADRVAALADRRDQRGQATAEYALVLLGAASIALLLVAWAAKSDRVGRLLDGIFDQLARRAR